MISQYQLNKSDIENVVLHVSSHAESVKSNYNTWDSLPEQKLWDELVSCILGSRINFEIAFFFTEQLSKKGLIDIDKILEDPLSAVSSIRDLLNSSIYQSKVTGKFGKYPFHQSRSEYIVRTALNIYEYNQTSLKTVLSQYTDEFDARDAIHELSTGIGYKQSSLFLRNIGFSQNLAILDTHVLKYMVFMDLLPDFTKIDIANKKKYVQTENILNNYALSCNEHISRLDIAIWVVMRLLEKEYSHGNCCFGFRGN
jgi:N-glycosylase/DNA lyase